MLSMMKQWVRKLEVLQPQPSTTVPNSIRGGSVEILALGQVRKNKNRLCQVFRSQMYA